MYRNGGINYLYFYCICVCVFVYTVCRMEKELFVYTVQNWRNKWKGNRKSSPSGPSAVQLFAIPPPSPPRSREPLPWIVNNAFNNPAGFIFPTLKWSYQQSLALQKKILLWVILFSQELGSHLINKIMKQLKHLNYAIISKCMVNFHNLIT